MSKIKKIIISIAIPIGVGIIGSLLGNAKQFQETVIQPDITPPALVFPIVWTILYILMGISSYLVFTSKSEYKKTALTIYGVQLFVNCIWNLFFFRLKFFLFSFILALILLCLSIIMILYFLRCNKVAGYIQIPYVFWLTFASFLTFNVYLLN